MIRVVRPAPGRLMVVQIYEAGGLHPHKKRVLDPSYTFKTTTEVTLLVRYCVLSKLQMQFSRADLGVGR